MLESLRKSVNTWPIRILFGLLVIAFLSWGVGDMVRGWDRGKPAIEVNGRGILPQDVTNEYKREYDRLQGMFGGRLTPEMAKQFGLMDSTIERLVTNSLLEESARQLDIVATDEIMRRHVASIPAFQDQQGQFNVSRYQQALSRAGMTEAGFLALERSNLLRRQVAESIGGGVSAPANLTEQLFRHREERRRAETITVSALSFPAPAAPDDAALETYYQSNTNQFMAPEFRSVAAIVIRPGDMAKPEDVTQQMLQEAYDRRLMEFSTAEKRNVRQVLLADENEAGRAGQLISAGADLEMIARTSSDTPKQVADLGWIDRTGLPAAVADTIFSLPEGKVGEPVQSPFGWHVFRVTGIQPATQKPLAEVQGQLAQEIAVENARDELYQMANALDDALGSGAGVAEAAKRLNLQVIEIPAIDAEGRDAAGAIIPNAPVDPRFLQLVFQTEQGLESAVTELETGGYMVVHVKSVTPAQPRPLAEVKAKVLESWQAAQRQQAAEKQANDLAERARKGESMEALAKQASLKLEQPEPFTRATRSSTLPPSVTTELFRGVPGTVSVAPGPGGAVLAKLTEIIPADPKADEAKLASARAQLAQLLGQDLMEQFVAAQRKALGVTVNRAMIDGESER
jgi:peptidyl-prolyl cis-trans isomerase D